MRRKKMKTTTNIRGKSPKMMPKKDVIKMLNAIKSHARKEMNSLIREALETVKNH